MNFEAAATPKLPREAIQNMEHNFGELQPVISESRLHELCDGDPDLTPLLSNLLTYAERYASDVWSMHQFMNEGRFETEEGAEEFKRMDDARTRLHTALVDSIAILSRALGRAELDNEWVRELSSGIGLDRPSCGAFALLLVYRHYLDTVE